eukprot:scaffold66923_cov65-Attheya_sp.AAC.1
MMNSVSVFHRLREMDPNALFCRAVRYLLESDGGCVTMGGIEITPSQRAKNCRFSERHDRKSARTHCTMGETWEPRVGPTLYTVETTVCEVWLRGRLRIVEVRFASRSDVRDVRERKTVNSPRTKLYQ